MVDVIYYNLLFFFISKLVLHDNTEKGLHPCLLVTLSSSLQAHHTVWRKLRQRAEKLVRTTVISLSYLTLFQRQWHQSQSTEANSGKEGCQCFGAAAWSRCWILSKLAPGPQPPWLPPSLLIAQSSQRTGFNGWFFFYCFAFIFWQKTERADSTWAAVLRKKAGVVLDVKDKPLLSELDIKDAAADTRSKEEVFLNPSRFKASFYDVVHHRLMQPNPLCLNITKSDWSAYRDA